MKEGVRGEGSRKGFVWIGSRHVLFSCFFLCFGFIVEREEGEGYDEGDSCHTGREEV